jgi:hypothetical protein
MLHHLRLFLSILVIFTVRSAAIAQNESVPPQPLSDEVFKALIHSKDTTDWVKIRMLTDTQAKSLSSEEGFYGKVGTLRKAHPGVWFNGLVSLTDNQAATLSKLGGFLCLDGLTSLSDRQFKELCQHRDGYGFAEHAGSGIRPEARFEPVGGLLCLNGLTSISDEQSKSFLHLLVFEMQLNGIISLSDKQVKNLSFFKGDVIQLGSLKGLTESQAKALAQYPGRIVFQELDTRSRELFKKYGGRIFGEKP